MQKERLLITTLSISLCAGAIATLASKNRFLAFVISWAVGMLASTLIQFIVHQKSISRAGQICMSLLTAVTAGLIICFILFFFDN